MIPANNPSYILGYHGCDSSIADQVIGGRGHLLSSSNDYDWLGHGIYFWEDNPERAEQWAKDRMSMPNSTITTPSVVGAILDLKFCLSLMRSDHLEILRSVYQTVEQSAESKNQAMPANSGGGDRFLRRLDCAVIQALHEIREEQDEPPIDSLRGLFQEGSEIYPGSSFCRGNHVQICVRNRDCIKGYFQPIYQ